MIAPAVRIRDRVCVGPSGNIFDKWDYRDLENGARVVHRSWTARSPKQHGGRYAGRWVTTMGDTQSMVFVGVMAAVGFAYAWWIKRKK